CAMQQQDRRRRTLTCLDHAHLAQEERHTGLTLDVVINALDLLRRDTGTEERRGNENDECSVHFVLSLRPGWPHHVQQVSEGIGHTKRATAPGLIARRTILRDRAPL